MAEQLVEALVARGEPFVLSLFRRVRECFGCSHHVVMRSHEVVQGGARLFK